jgi:hypothetical protein
MQQSRFVPTNDDNIDIGDIIQYIREFANRFFYRVNASEIDYWLQKYQTY